MCHDSIILCAMTHSYMTSDEKMCNKRPAPGCLLWAAPEIGRMSTHPPPPKAVLTAGYSNKVLCVCMCVRMCVRMYYIVAITSMRFCQLLLVQVQGKKTHAEIHTCIHSHTLTYTQSLSHAHTHSHTHVNMCKCRWTYTHSQS